MKQIVIFFMVLASVSLAQAQQKSKNAKHSFEVNGNCDQCKKRIEKAAYSVTGVKVANWDVATHQLSITLNEQKSALPEVKKAVAAAGHDTDETKATDEAYNGLHSCCKYERE